MIALTYSQYVKWSPRHFLTNTLGLRGDNSLVPGVVFAADTKSGCWDAGWFVCVCSMSRCCLLREVSVGEFRMKTGVHGCEEYPDHKDVWLSLSS